MSCATCGGVTNGTKLGHCSKCFDDERQLAVRALEERDEVRRENAKLRGALARAPCRWHTREHDECSEAFPCVTHHMLSGALESESTPTGDE